MKKIEIEVTNCKDCFLKNMSGWEGEEYTCSIDSKRRLVFKRDCIKHKDVIKFEDDKKWCPLKTKEVVIKKI